MKTSTAGLLLGFVGGGVYAQVNNEDFQYELCTDMTELVYGEETDYLCAFGANDDSTAVYCDMEVQLGYSDTCRNTCSELGYTCTAAWDDLDGESCVWGEEITCDTSLHTKICRCEGDEVEVTVPPAEVSTTAEIDKCESNWGVKFKANSTSVSEYQVDIEFDDDAQSGEYVISARAYANRRFDGTEQLLHSRWWDADDNILGTTTDGFPSTRNNWETISVAFDTGDVVPARASLYFGYPIEAVHGWVALRWLSLTDDRYNQFIDGGDLACGIDAPQYSESDSRGDYRVKRYSTEELCYVTQTDIDGMCGDTVQLSGTDGTYRNGLGFDAPHCADACISYGAFECSGFAVDGDGDCHLFEDANECVVDNGEPEMTYYEMSLDCGELITCDLTIDNNLDAIYFNNEDITDNIQVYTDIDDGSSYNWNHLKTISFRWDGMTTGVLAIAGHEFDDAGSCAHSGLLLGCSSDNPDSDWNFVRSDTSGAYLNGWSGNKNEEPPEDSDGHEWFAINYDASDWEGVCESTSSFYCCAEGDIVVGNGQVGLEAEKVWPCGCNTDAFFRVTVEGVEEKDLINEDSNLQCTWEEEHPDKYLSGCTEDNCYDFQTLDEAKRACEGYGLDDCGGVTYNGFYETRLGSILIDSPSGESSWLMTNCDEREYDCVDPIDKWEDSLGYTCDEYGAYKYCTEDGEEGNGWELDWGDFADYADENGYDATEACCVCGAEGEDGYTLQPCFEIADAGECLSSYDSRDAYASPCCVIDPRVNGNYCEPQSYIEDNGYDEYATCKETDDTAGGDCLATCMGENTCDYWYSLSSDFTCSALESKMDCDCSGCACPSTTPWRLVVEEVYGGGDQVQLTELSFLDADGNIMEEGVAPDINPGMTSKGDATDLSDGDADTTQQLNCDPLPCGFTYELTEEPAAFQLGYADSYNRLPSLMLVQYKDDDLEWVTVWSGQPEAPCGTDTAYTDKQTTCDALSVTEFSTEPLENCPNSCLGPNTCDYWIGSGVGDYTCATLESTFGCDCWQCFCGSDTTAGVALPPSTTTVVEECTWWEC